MPSKSDSGLSKATIFLNSPIHTYSASYISKIQASKCLFLLIFCFLCNSIFGQKARNSLYRIDDPNIITLDSTNYDEVVNNPKRDYLIMAQFYLHWMEGGKKYAETYRQFAGNVSSWDKIFKVAAINCAAEQNTQFCTGFNSFPNMKLIDPPIQNGQNDIESSHSVNGLPPVHGLIRATIDRITSLSQSQKAPKSWPDIRVIKAHSLADLVQKINGQNIPPNSTIVVLIEDNLDLMAARKTLLDLSSVPSDMVARVVARDVNLISELQQKIQGDKPALIVISPSRKLEEIKIIGWSKIKSNDLKPRDALTPYLMENYVEKMIKIKRVYMADMYKGLRHVMYKEVLAHQVLNYSQVQALTKWVTAVHRYFPFDNDNPRRFFMRMENWMKGRKPGKDVMIQEVQAIMKAGNEGFIPQIDNYIHCKGDKSGYPCSLWLIFHTLTVSEYDKHTRNDTKVLKYAHQFPSVIYALRDYVKYFYSCAECVDHFTNMSANLKSELTSANSSILWLWEAHNKISKRISDRDPLNRKPQFPTRSVCPKCFTKSGHRNITETLNFLMDFYRKDKIIKVRSSSHQQKASLITLVVIISTIFSKMLLL